MRFYACFVTLCCVVSICSGQECCNNHDIYTHTTERIGGYIKNGHLSIFEEIAISVMDYNQSRFLLNKTIDGDSNFMLFEDHIQNIMWAIFPDEECLKIDITEESKPSRCIKDNAKYLGQFNNPGDVLVNRWQYEYEKPSDLENGKGPIDYNVDGCIPSRELVVGTWTDTKNVDLLFVYDVYNFEVLTDVSEYFILPSNCNSTNEG
ncbi:uncharacterized protein LOC117119536 [Anneissia japonica]|uniref:uncharacterized protein LOC117119536 n=1 Tax=Anneissia japonica TaxID=1529436 RepID=UPI001425B561|nr:uncharacterized protein LOC117119536 [Anneissia japonica]